MNPAKLAHSGLNTVKAYTPGKPISELKREMGIKQIYKLASNENAFGPSPKAIKAIKASLSNINRYPDASCFELKKALSQKYSLPKNRFCIGNGSDELIVMALRAFVSQKHSVITSNPTFLIYDIATRVLGAKSVQVPMVENCYDLDGIRSRINASTRMIFIANPDNPTGTFITKLEFEKFMKKIPVNCLVFLDEAYFEYALSNTDYPNGYDFKKYKNLIVSRTFSKAYGLSALRVGYAMASSDIVAGMEKVREPFNVNLLAQVAATAALKDHAHLKKVIRMNRIQMKNMTQIIDELGVEYIPSATNFVMIRIGRKAETVYGKLLKKGVIVRHMKGWGLPEYLRITIGKPEENRKFISALKSKDIIKIIESRVINSK